MDANAVVFTAPHTVAFQPIQCPDPGPGDVVVEVTHSWISNGTEGSYLRGERVDGDTPYREGDVWPFPVVAGYQKIGTIAWIGSDVTDLEIGETVFSTVSQVLGMHHTYGGQVSPTVCPRHDVWKLPPGIDPLAFAGMVLTQVGYNAGIRPRLGIGDAAVVIGDGLVGHWSAQTLAWRGAEVALIGRHPDRLQYFTQKPFRHGINASTTDWPQAIRSLFPNGVQVAVDTIGSVETLEAAQPLMKRFGHLVSAGFYGTQDRLALQPPRYGELTIDLVSGWTHARMDETLRLIAGGYLETLPLITHHFPRRTSRCRLDVDRDQKRTGPRRHSRLVMKILQVTAPGQVVWRDAPMPEPGPDEVLVKILGVTTCPHWDLHIMSGRPMFPGMDLAYPYIPGQPGHEAMGEVVAVGDGITEFKPGMHVAAWRDPGDRPQGCYAQYAALAAADLIAIPEHLLPESIAALELAMCVQGSFDQLLQQDTLRGKHIAISGLGPAGLIAVQMGRSYGAKTIVGIDPLPERRALALKWGADVAYSPGEAALPTSPHGIRCVRCESGHNRPQSIYRSLDAGHTAYGCHFRRLARGYYLRPGPLVGWLCLVGIRHPPTLGGRTGTNAYRSRATGPLPHRHLPPALEPLCRRRGPAPAQRSHQGPLSAVGIRSLLLQFFNRN